MMTMHRISALAVIALVAVAAPAAAKDKAHNGAPAAKKVKRLPAAVRDCVNDGDLDAVYSRGHLRQALRKLPADIGAYTNCADLLRFAYATGPNTKVRRAGRIARLRMRCAGTAYPVKLTTATATLGAGTVKACARGTTTVRIPVGAAGFKRARKHRAVTVDATPAGVHQLYRTYLGRQA